MTASQRTQSLFGELSGRRSRPDGPLPPHTPLLLAIHGGTYTSAYFDVPGASLFAQAAANNVPMIAPNRPGYGASALLSASKMDIEGQARYLVRAWQDAWQRHGTGTQGIFLIGHSIGGAIAATMAATLADERTEVPLLGIAISGVGLNTPPEFQSQWEQLPDTPTVEMPPSVKDIVMFGPEGSFDPAMVRESDVANAAAPKPELIDIVGGWHLRAPDILGRIRVPVHYRQAEFDRLWIVNQGEVDGFAAALSASPRVDAQMVRGTGHCMDFHHVGRALQMQQIGFALQCAGEHARR